MAKNPNKAADFLRAMGQIEGDEDSAAPTPVAENKRASVVNLPKKAAAPKAMSRAGLKHFGGYLEDDTLEKIALLRVRLKKDNSELIKLAIDELHARHNAKKAFGDA